jgi:uncharacterized membrane protein
MTISRRNIKIIIIVIAAAIVIAALVTGIVLGVTGKTVSSLPPGKASYDRLSTLDHVLTSIFGPKWVEILITFVVILLVILFLLYLLTIYLLTKKEITVGEKGAKGITWSIVSLAIVMSLAIITAGIISLVEYYKRAKEQSETLGDFSDTTQAQQVVELVGIGIGVLVVIGVGIGVWLWWRKRRKKKRMSS